MKKTIIFLTLLVVIIAAGVYFSRGVTNPDEKLYVAARGEGQIIVIDPIARKVLRGIDLSSKHDDGVVRFLPQDVRVAPDGNTVWVVARSGGYVARNVPSVSEAHAHGGVDDSAAPEEVIVIDATNDFIIKRIPIEFGINLTRIVLSPDGAFAYVTAESKDSIYKINARTFSLEREIRVPLGSGPYGIGMSPDGEIVSIAMLGSKKLGFLDFTAVYNEIALDGAPAEIAVTPDGARVLAGLFDTKQLALYSVATGGLDTISLPAGARGPLQIAITPDSKRAYITDQGYFFNQPSGEHVYVVDLASREVVSEIKVGTAPHGIVISRDGRFAYVSHLLGGDISVVDIASNQDVGRISVGREPAAVSIWYKNAPQ